MAQYDDTSIVVYQAYTASIGLFAAHHGYFGGEFSYERMSWIMPNFLWMMYRSGWGTKHHQEVTLSVRLKRSAFDSFLEAAVSSSFDSNMFSDKDSWALAVAASEVRLQWDPDHSPSGGALRRRALQLGLRGHTLKEYGQSAIVGIEDISEFVAEQRGRLGTDALVTPVEHVYVPSDPAIAEKLGLAGI